MPILNRPVSIEWGTDSAPVEVRILDASGVSHVPEVVTPIAEVWPGSGVFGAVVACDSAWGACQDYWIGSDGTAFAGNGVGDVNVMQINRSPAQPLDGNAQESETVLIEDTRIG